MSSRYEDAVAGSKRRSTLQRPQQADDELEVEIELSVRGSFVDPSNSRSSFAPSNLRGSQVRGSLTNPVPRRSHTQGYDYDLASPTSRASLRRPSGARRRSFNPNNFGPDLEVGPPEQKVTPTRRRSSFHGLMEKMKTFALRKKATEYGPDVFQMFPLPEIKSVKNQRGNWVFNLFLAWELAVCIAVVFACIGWFLNTGKFVPGVVLVRNEIPLDIRAEGCSVYFKTVRRVSPGSPYLPNSSIPDYGSCERGNLDECGWWGPKEIPFLQMMVRTLYRFGKGNDCEYQMTSRFDKDGNLFGFNHYCVDYEFNRKTLIDANSMQGNDKSYVKFLSTSYLNEYDIKHPLQNRVKWWTGNSTGANASVVLEGYRFSASTTPCKISVYTYNNMASVSVSATVSSINHKMEIRKVDALDLLQPKLSPRWRLDIDHLDIKGAATSVTMTNLFVKHVSILIQSGAAKINGLFIKSHQGGNQSIIQDKKSEIKTGIDLGERKSVGVFLQLNGTDRCLSKQLDCGGPVHVAMLSTVQVDYSQPEGIVCAAASTITEESNNCEVANESNFSNTSSTTNYPQTCDGVLLLCSARNRNCTDDHGKRKLSVRALQGGVYVAAVNYHSTQHEMKNVRKTEDGRRCQFPFTYRGKIHFDCTTEQTEKPWCDVVEEDYALGTCQINASSGIRNCSAGSVKETWGFCSQYETHQGYAYKRKNPEKSVHFDKTGEANVLSIKPFENEVLNSPIMWLLNMESKSGALGSTMWVYTSRTPYVLIRNDVLSRFSAGLVSARFPKDDLGLVDKTPIRVSPSFCPVEALPDATLSTQQMGRVSDAIYKTANGVQTSIVSWFGEYSMDPTLRASGKASEFSGLDALDPTVWYSDGLSFYKKTSDGTYAVKKSNTLLGDGTAKAAIYLTYLLIVLYFCMSLCVIVPATYRASLREYDAYIRERRKLSLTEAQVKLDKIHKKLEKEYSDISANDDSDEFHSHKFWKRKGKKHQSTETNSDAIPYFDAAIRDLGMQIDRLALSRRGENMLKVARVHRSASYDFSEEDGSGEQEKIETSVESGSCASLCKSFNNAFCRACCARERSARSTTIGDTALELLHSKFSRISAIRSKYRTTIDSHLEFFRAGERQQQFSVHNSIESEHCRTVMQIFPGMSPKISMPKTESLFMQLWVDIEQYFGEEIAKDSSGYVAGFAAAKAILNLVETYCHVEDKEMIRINKCFEVLDKVWLLRQREISGFVEPLNIWEIPDVLYHLFVAPFFKNSISNFLDDEVIDARKVKNEWFVKQNIMVQYALSLSYFIEKYTGSNRQFVQYHYVPTGDEGMDAVDDGDDSSDSSSSDDSSDDENDRDGMVNEANGVKRKESYLQVHSIPGLPLKTWNLGNQKRLHSYMGDIEKTGSVKLSTLFDRYNTYCDAKGLNKLDIDEFLGDLREDFEFKYDTKSKSFDHVKFEPPEGRDMSSADPWPELTPLGYLLTAIFFLMPPNVFVFPVYWGWSKFKAYGVSIVLAPFRMVVIAIPAFLVLIILYLTTDPARQFAPKGSIFGLYEVMHVPYRFFDIPVEFGKQYWTVDTCIYICLGYFAVGAIDLLFYFLRGDPLDKSRFSPFFKVGDWVIVKEGKTTRGDVSVTALFCKLTCCKGGPLTKDEREGQMEKDRIYKVKQVNITRAGKVKDYVMIRSRRRDIVGSLVPCDISKIYGLKKEEDNVENKEIRKVFKKLQRIQPPQVTAFFHNISHTMFLFSSTFVLSLVFAYFGMVGSWWVLGAIIQPERTLAFASTVLVMIGAVKALLSDFEKQRDALMKNLETCVSDFLESLLQQTSRVTEGVVKKIVPKLPNVFAGLNMEAVEIFQHLKSAEGQAILFGKAIEQVVVKNLEPALQSDPRIQYIKEGLMCLGSVDRDQQLLAFKSLGAKIVVDAAFGVTKPHQQLNSYGANLMRSIAEAGLASNSINARDAIEKVERNIMAQMKEGDASRSFVKFGLWFLKVCADDQRVFFHLKEKVLRYFKAGVPVINKRSAMEKDAKMVAKEGAGKSIDIVLGLGQLFLSFSTMKDIIIQEFAIGGQKTGTGKQRRLSTVKKSLTDVFNIGLLNSCDEIVLKMIKLLTASKGKLTTQVILCQEKMYNIIFDQLLATMGLLKESDDGKARKKRFRPIMGKMMKLAAKIWTCVFGTGVDLTSDDDIAELIKETLKLSAKNTTPKSAPMRKSLEDQIQEDELRIMRRSSVGRSQSVSSRGEKTQKVNSDELLFSYFVKEILIYETEIQGTRKSGSITRLICGHAGAQYLHTMQKDIFVTGGISREKWSEVCMKLDRDSLDRVVLFFKKSMDSYCPKLSEKLKKSDGDGAFAQLLSGFDVLSMAIKLPLPKTNVQRTLLALIDKIMDLSFSEDPPMRQKAAKIITSGKKLLTFVQKHRASASEGDGQKKKKITKTEKYQEMFKQVDTSGDGEVDFEEFLALCNENLKLNLSTQKCKSLMAKSDKNGSGTLDMSEFEVGMKLLEKEIVNSALAKAGLSKRTMYPTIAGICLWLVCILVFILMGFSAFTEGTAFGAGIGGVMPLIAGKSSGLKDLISKINIKRLVERTLKDDFQKG